GSAPWPVARRPGQGADRDRRHAARADPGHRARHQGRLRGQHQPRDRDGDRGAQGHAGDPVLHAPALRPAVPLGRVRRRDPGPCVGSCPRWAMSTSLGGASFDADPAGARALTEAEEHLVAAQGAGGIGIFDWEISSDRVYWSTEVYRLMGLAPDAVAPSSVTW